MIPQFQIARVVSSIALLLVSGQLIAPASCDSVAKLSEEARIVQAAALNNDSNQIDRTQDSTQQLHGRGGETSSKFKLIKFEAFQARFNKHYATLVERVFRLRQFIASLVRVSRSIFAYLHRKSTYFLRINRYSDLTPDELRKKFGQRPDSGVDLSTSGHDDNSNHGRVLSRQKRWLFGSKKESKSESESESKSESKSESDSNSESELEYEYDYEYEFELEFDLDWRDEASPKCLNEPTVESGDCGCCYAIATMSLFEWLYCKQHGHPIKLSEQYLIDCGQEFGLRGCERGNLIDAINFTVGAGLMRADELPYVGEQQTCRKEDLGPAIQVNSAEPRVVKEHEKWPSELREAPLLVYLPLSDSLFHYAGGLFELSGCQEDVGHFALLVAYGRDPNNENRPFFLLSNSFGPDYGESGYILVAADRIPSDCVYALAVKADL